jgi:hypothetical protein
MAADLDEFERGYPRLELSFLLDVVIACQTQAEKPSKSGGRGKKRAAEEEHEPAAIDVKPYHPALKSPEGLAALRRRIHSGGPYDSATSWRALRGRLGRLHRLKVFDGDPKKAPPPRYRNMLKPGAVSIIDLSDSGASALNNLVIADLLRGIQQEQDRAYRAYERAKKTAEPLPLPPRVLLIIEEAHEFLSAERIDKMATLFEQVSRVARRGRKRGVGLVFVTQLPQHLPRQLLGLVNSFILHKITDPQVVAALQRTVGGIDEALWGRLPALAPGQAIVSFPHLARPLLVAVDPAPCKLRMMD